MNDLLPGEAARFASLERRFAACMQSAGFGELRTPLVEPLGLFVRSIGEGTDVVDKEMYAFEHHDEKLALRPEGTASAVRAYLQHKVHNSEPITRWYYAGAMFRAERPQKGRYRQFHQLGAEVFGDPGPGVDAEIIDLLFGFLKQLGLPDLSVHVGTLGGPASKLRYREALVAYLTPRRAELSEDSQRRLERNPLRILDSKREEDRRVVADAPGLLDSLDDEDRKHFDRFRGYLDALQVPYVVDPSLVRGLDYYSRTLFEIKGAKAILGAGDTLAGGGRYDGLVESLGGPKQPAFGFAAGVERLLLAQGEPTAVRAPRVVVVPSGEAGCREALLLVRELRHLGVTAETDLRGGAMKNQLRRAVTQGARLALIVGDDELARGVVAIKDLDAQSQSEVPRSETALRVAATMQPQAVP